VKTVALDRAAVVTGFHHFEKNNEVLYVSLLFIDYLFDICCNLKTLQGNLTVSKLVPTSKRQVYLPDPA
jgi:hypothetical protein